MCITRYNAPLGLIALSADGEFDAAEIDRELISARLKQDVLEHSGKVYLFVADSVRLLAVISMPILTGM